MKYDIRYYFKTQEELEDIAYVKYFIEYAQSAIKNPDLLDTEDKFDNIIELLEQYLPYVSMNRDGLEIPRDFNYLINYEHLYDIWVIGADSRKQKIDNQTLKFALMNNHIVLEELLVTILNSLKSIKSLKFKIK